jgi:hypothetical protein
MKDKLSVTIDHPLVRFLDSLPGRSRSEKLERVLRRFRQASEDITLRRALSRHRNSEFEEREHEAWVRTMEQDQWNESTEVISGRSNS